MQVDLALGYDGGSNAAGDVGPKRRRVSSLLEGLAESTRVWGDVVIGAGHNSAAMLSTQM